MKTRIFLPLYAIVGFGVLLLLQGCGAAGASEDAITISGVVTNQTTGNAIQDAIVEIVSPSAEAQTTTSDSVGEFSFTLEVDSSFTVTVEADKQGFIPQSTSFKVAPEVDITDLELALQAESTDGDPGGGGDESGGVSGPAAGAASMLLVGLTNSTINVTETGGVVNTAFTFEVQDSAGRAVERTTDVNFEIISGPGGGESITPETAQTNPKGRVTSNLFAGDSSGTVQVEAVINRDDVGITIRSRPILITIASGFPVEENFNLGAFAHNFDAYGYIDESHTNAITASVGDLKNNPVKAGTAVYYTTKYGGHITGDAVTNENGFATTQLFANGSTPSGHPNGIGFIEVIAQTVNKDNEYISTQATILLTTPEAVITISPTTINVPNAGGQTFDVTITDQNGYPMAKGTQFSVTGEGLTFSGDIVDLTFGDYFNPGPGTTEFVVNASDADPDVSEPADASMTIIVQTPSGITTTKSIQGSRAKSN